MESAGLARLNVRRGELTLSAWRDVGLLGTPAAPARVVHIRRDILITGDRGGVVELEPAPVMESWQPERSGGWMVFWFGPCGENRLRAVGELLDEAERVIYRPGAALKKS